MYGDDGSGGPCTSSPGVVHVLRDEVARLTADRASLLQRLGAWNDTADARVRQAVAAARAQVRVWLPQLHQTEAALRYGCGQLLVNP